MNKPIRFPPVSSKAMTVAAALALMVFIGFLDYITGRNLALSAIYLAPICWAGWAAGRRAGILLAFASTVVWFIADRFSGAVYGHPFTHYWNTLMILVFFMVVVYLLTAFQAAHYHLEETVQRRTEALQKEIVERKRLETAKLQAERLASVGTMAAKVAHEIRNPLGSITLNLDLIQKEINKDLQGQPYSAREELGLAKEIREELRRIQRVIEDYLQFARLPKLHRQPVALNSLLEQKLPFLHPELERVKSLSDLVQGCGLVVWVVFPAAGRTAELEPISRPTAGSYRLPSAPAIRRFEFWSRPAGFFNSPTPVSAPRPADAAV